MSEFVVTDLNGGKVYLNPDAWVSTHPPVKGETSSKAKSVVTMSSGFFEVQETSEQVMVLIRAAKSKPDAGPAEK